ncbi:MAG: hypothetical protein ACM3N0_13355 [Chloroflexota bacterium]
MKLARLIGLVCVAAIAALALIGTSSAMASTALCSADEDPCATENQLTQVHFDATNIVIHTSLMDYECDARLLGEVGELAESQVITATELSYFNCNQGCTRTVESLGKFSLEQTAEEKAIITGSGFQVHVQCGTTINCTYAFNELTGTVLGALLTGDTGHITYSEATLEKVGGLLCPKEATLNALFVSLEGNPIYVES